MEFEPTEIPDVLVIRCRRFEDHRGYIFESYRRTAFAAAGLDLEFVQENESTSGPGVLRGLHYQLAQPQGKLVRVVAGAAWDVAVDLRPGSPTFGRWTGRELRPDGTLFWIPPGFAHGFCVLGDAATMVYRCTDYYAPADQRSILWNDPDLGITWPIDDPVLSEKDAEAPSFQEVARELGERVA